MADAVLEVEARLKDFISQNLSAIEGKLNDFSTSSKTHFGKVETSSNALNRAFGGVKSSLVSFASQFGPAAIVAGGLAMTMGKLKESLSFADQLDKLNRQYGLSTDFLQKLNAIAGASGSSLGGLAMGVKDLTINLGKLKAGDKELTSIFSKFGITADGKKIEDVYVEIMAKMGDMTDDTERLTVATAVFGKGAREAMATAVQGADGFKKAYEEAADGVSRLTPAEIAQLDAAGDAFTRLGQNATVAAGKIITALDKQFDVMSRLTVGRESAESISDSYTIKALASEKKRNELFEFRTGLLQEIAVMEGNIAKNRSMGLDDSGMEKVLKRLGEVKANAAEAGKELGSLSDKKTGAGSFGITGAEAKKDEAKKAEESYDLYRSIADQKKDYDKQQREEMLKNAQAVIDAAKSEAEFTQTSWNAEEELRKKKVQDTVAANQKIIDSDAERLAAKKVTAAQELAYMDRMESATRTTGDSLNTLAKIGIQNSKANNQEKKNMLTAMAIAEGAAAGISAAQKIWSTASTWQEGVAETIVVEAGLTALTAANVATIQNAKFARGTRSTRGGMVLVGEDGPELMQAPVGSAIYNNYETQNMLGGSSINLSLNLNGGNVDSAAADKITGSLEALGRALVQADRRGYLDEYKMKNRK